MGTPHSGAMLRPLEVVTVMTHELWRERKTGEVWAMRLVDGTVIGCCGPLASHDRDAPYLRTLDYLGERAEWVDGNREEFDLAESTPV
jgi:hypothetical protein